MEMGMYASTVEFSFLDSDLQNYGSRQCKLAAPSFLSGDIAEAAFRLFKRSYGHWPKPLRKVGVRACDLVEMNVPRQLTIFEDAAKAADKEKLERAVNTLRNRFGNKIVQRAIMYLDSELSGVDAKKDHIIHPVGVFTGGVSTAWGYKTKIMQ